MTENGSPTAAVVRDSRPSDRAGSVVLGALCLALIAGPFLLRLSLLQTRPFDPDELQHLHAAWAVSEGLLPYRDFFEHHMPGLPFLLSGIMGSFDIAGHDGHAIAFLFAARAMMWGFAGVSIGLTAALGTRAGGWSIGLIGTALLSTSLVFVGRTLEIRPDVPALACWLAALAMLTIALRKIGPTRRTLLVFGGLGVGCGLVLNQKLLLAGPGLLLLFAWPWAIQRVKTIAGAAGDLVAFGAGVAVPIVILMGSFWSQDALTDLIRGAFLANLGWPQETTAATTLRWLALRDPFLAALGAAGFVQGGILLGSRDGAGASYAALWLPAASLLAGLFLIPAPYPQYMLLVLPPLAILAAAFLWTAMSTMLRPGNAAHGAERTAWIAGAAAGAVTLAAALGIARPYFVHALVYPVMGVVALLTSWFLARRGAAAWAAAVLLVALSVHGAQQLRWMQDLSNADALAQMRFVHSSTSPTDRVLDGFSGLAWFRPHASDHPFLHGGVRARLTADEVSRIVGLLGPCDTRPKLVILDEHLRQLSPELERAVARHYGLSSVPPIWVRSPDPSCDPPRASR